jgi:hypothetical protein
MTEQLRLNLPILLLLVICLLILTASVIVIVVLREHQAIWILLTSTTTCVAAWEVIYDHIYRVLLLLLLSVVLLLSHLKGRWGFKGIDRRLDKVSVHSSLRLQTLLQLSYVHLRYGVWGRLCWLYPTCLVGLRFGAPGVVHKHAKYLFQIGAQDLRGIDLLLRLFANFHNEIIAHSSSCTVCATWWIAISALHSAMRSRRSCHHCRFFIIVYASNKFL